MRASMLCSGRMATCTTKIESSYSFALGQPVFSLVDSLTKPIDAYALRLQTGQTLRVQVSADLPGVQYTVEATAQ